MMFLHMFDLVRQHHESAIDLIQLAAIELDLNTAPSAPDFPTDVLLTQIQTDP